MKLHKCAHQYHYVHTLATQKPLDVFLGPFEKLLKATISFVMSVGPSVRKEQPAPTGRIFMKPDEFYRKSAHDIHVLLKYYNNGAVT